MSQETENYCPLDLLELVVAILGGRTFLAFPVIGAMLTPSRDGDILSF